MHRRPTFCSAFGPGRQIVVFPLKNRTSSVNCLSPQKTPPSHWPEWSSRSIPVLKYMILHWRSMGGTEESWSHCSKMVEAPASLCGRSAWITRDSPSLGSEWVIQATHGLQSPPLLSPWKDIFTSAEISDVFSSQLPGWPARLERSQCSLNKGGQQSWAIWNDITVTDKGSSHSFSPHFVSYHFKYNIGNKPFIQYPMR